MLQVKNATFAATELLPTKRRKLVKILQKWQAEALILLKVPKRPQVGGTFFTAKRANGPLSSRSPPRVIIPSFSFKENYDFSQHSARKSG